jgi:hypothetical protein
MRRASVLSSFRHIPLEHGIEGDWQVQPKYLSRGCRSKCRCLPFTNADHYTIVRGCCRGSISSYRVVISMSPYFSYWSSELPYPPLEPGIGLEISAGREGCSLRFRRRNHARAAPTMTAAITPTAMPALAAAVRPAAASVSSSFSLSSFVAPSVGAEVDVEDEDELKDVDEDEIEDVVEVDWTSVVAGSAVVDAGASVLEVPAGTEDSAGCDVVVGGAEVESDACEEVSGARDVVSGGAVEEVGAGGALDDGGADDSGAAGADDGASAGGENPRQ